MTANMIAIKIKITSTNIVMMTTIVVDISRKGKESITYNIREKEKQRDILMGWYTSLTGGEYYRSLK